VVDLVQAYLGSQTPIDVSPRAPAPGAIDPAWIAEPRCAATAELLLVACASPKAHRVCSTEHLVA
jgi:hypothetical protein